VFKDLRFELQFDDPRQPDEHRITIRGDRTELEILCDAVNSYVQNFLSSSPTQVPLTLGTAPSSTFYENSGQESFASPTSGTIYPDAIAARALDSQPGQFGDSAPVSNLEEFNPKPRSLQPRAFANTIYLEPKGLLAHNLFLGNLATEESGPAINLSVTQLFDLATALDEYATEGVALPTLNVLSWKKAPPAWAYTAAAVLVTVGVTTAAVKYFDRSNTKQQAAIPAATQQPTPIPPIAQVPPLPTASISPLPTPTVPLPLSPAPPLPPPSPVSNPTNPTTSGLPSSSSAGERPTTTIAVNPGEPAATQRKAPASTVGSGTVATRPRSTAPSGTTSSSQRSSSSSSSEKPPVLAKPTLPATAPPLNLPPLASNSNSGDRTTATAPSARNASTSSETSQAGAAAADRPDRSTLFDNIPQVAEARNYLQERWKPPSGFTQTLEYHVLLNKDGSIQRIIPLGKTATDNIERTSFPAPGNPFVSPVEGNGVPKLRVVFTPDGKVQTFLEGREASN
jgi:hypothetical protein